MSRVERGLSTTELMRFVDLATDALAVHREEIDALNVFPVPDGDTGTNMYLTVSAGREAAREALATAQPADPADPYDPAVLELLLRTFARGTLLGARGNSGVILSQIMGALTAELFAAAGRGEGSTGRELARVVAAALQAAATAAYDAVGAPVEGTILTVARAAADAAANYAATEHARVAEVFAVAAAAARRAVDRTPEQLKVLRESGVVDAGAKGLSVILDSAEVAVTGKVQLREPRTPRPGARPAPVDQHPSGDPSSDGGSDGGSEGGSEGPSYEVMYLLDADESAIADLRSTLAGLGDSLAVVGGDGLWNVHVHVDDVGAAIEAGVEAGRPHRIRVTHFADQVAEGSAGHAHAEKARDRQGRAVVAVSAGDGLGELFGDCGAAVVPGGPGRRPSAGQILEAILATGAAEVAVLPNDNDSVRVAQIAARTAEEDAGIRVMVIPTQAQVQGLAALAVHDPARAFDPDVLEMTATAAHVRHGAVTIAAKQAITMAGPCEPGDVLGVVSGDFAVVGQDLAVVAGDVLGRLLGGGGELVTVVVGQGASTEVVAQVVDRLGETHPHVDVDVLDGGQDRYPFLLSVE